MYQTDSSRLVVLCSVLAVAACEKGPAADVASTANAVTYAQNSQCVTLLAGQTINAGSVCTAVSGQDLVVTYKTTNGWTLNEVQLWVGQSLSTMPTTKTGNPQVGLFPYKASNLSGATTYTFDIPLSSLSTAIDLCGQTLLIAAHAAVQQTSSDGAVNQQTGWGQGTAISSRGNWGMYFSYTVVCDTSAPPPSTLTCQTGFAQGNVTFISLGLTRDRWGWENGPLAPGIYTKPIYAGAAQNDISKGTLVGQVTISYDGKTVNVSYQMNSGYVLEATHVYAGTTNVSTIAPGQYGNTHDPLSNVSSDSYSISGFDGQPVYVVAHAVVCN